MGNGDRPCFCESITGAFFILEIKPFRTSFV